MYRKLMWLRGRRCFERTLVVAGFLTLQILLWVRRPGDPKSVAAAFLAVMAGGALLRRGGAVMVAVVIGTAPWLVEYAKGAWFGGGRGFYTVVPWSLLAIALARLTQVVTDRAGLADALAAATRERMVLVDRKGRIVFATQATTAATSSGAGKMAGSSVFDYMADSFRPEAARILEAAFHGSGLVHTPIQLVEQGGTTVPVVVTVTPVRYRGETLAMGVTHEVTGPEPTQRLFSSGMDSIDILIVARGPDGRIIWCNQAFADACGCSKRDAVGTEVSPGGVYGLHKAAILADMAAGKPTHVEQALPDGRTMAFSAYPIANPDGSLFAMIGFIKNITDRKQAEARIMQAERMAAVGHVAAGVAHNLNNVLGAISANADLLSLSEDPNVAGVAEEILVAVAHGSTMIRNLYELAGRRPSPALTAVPAVEIVQSVLQLMAAQIRLGESEVSVAVPEPLAFVADANQLRQVLMNLVLNSLQAMPRGGRLRISAAATPKGTVALSVADNGCGIPPEHMSRLFEPFFTTKGAINGTGLGLSTSLAMIRAMGGDVQVSSVPGEGTTVTIELPAAGGGR